MELTDSNCLTTRQDREQRYIKGSCRGRERLALHCNAPTLPSLTNEGRSPPPINRTKLQCLHIDGENDVILHILEDDVVADNAHIVDDAIDESLHIACWHLQVLSVGVNMTYEAFHVSLTSPGCPAEGRQHST
ncbi:hypothetical protein E2C01_007817 [Portunus trituberculatus]|uniref:Uncharacterized protein n=1 Tax=Portunus trituberculatus TaxID=210409 RepID=A0A5B7D4U7_PORTR|nr:hypothetical protein [Portunus trituberculatus]